MTVKEAVTRVNRKVRTIAIESLQHPHNVINKVVMTGKNRHIVRLHLLGFSSGGGVEGTYFILITASNFLPLF